jgi:hypothetical protein
VAAATPAAASAGSRRAVPRLAALHRRRRGRHPGRSQRDQGRGDHRGQPRRGDFITVGKSNAIGIQAIEGAVNDDNVLVLGGPDAEYNGCPNFLILNHFFDGAEDPVTTTAPRSPPSSSWCPAPRTSSARVPGAAVVQYLVYNEFEQRFSTSRAFQCKQFSLISNIDTSQKRALDLQRGVSGTLTGQTRINPIGSGVLAVAHEIHESSGLADFNVHFQGDRADPDFIILP